MPQVPYNPVPQADPGATLPEVHPDIPAAAFGGEVAHAIAGFGREVSGAGNAIFERAMQLQQMNNQAEARKAAADYTIEVGKLSAQYNTLSGDDAVKAMPQYGQALKQLREKYKSGMSSPMSRNMFDNESLGTMSHAIINGASHSAAQNKAFVAQTHEGRIRSLTEEMAGNPNDETLARKNAEKIGDEQRSLNRMKGLPDDNEASIATVKIAKSAAIGTQIDAADRTDSLAARRMYEENEKNMTADDKKKYNERTVASVRNQLTGDGVRDLVAANTDEDGKLKITEKELYSKVQELGGKYKDADPGLAKALDSAVKSAVYQNSTMRKHEIAEADNTLFGLMQKGMSFSDAKKDPDGGLAYKTLNSKQQMDMQEKFENYAESANRKYNEAVMTQLHGMRENKDAMHELLEIDPNDKELNLNRSNIDTVKRWQREIRKDMGAVGKSDQYMKVLKDHFTDQMSTLKLMDRGDKSTKKNYDHFVGTLMSAVDAWKEEKGQKTYPTPLQFQKEIAPLLMKGKINEDMWAKTHWPNVTYGHQVDKSGPKYKNFIAGKRKESEDKGEYFDQFEADRIYTNEVFKSIIATEKKKAAKP